MHLHEWIDAVFGQLPVVVVDAPHPQRGIMQTVTSPNAPWPFTFERGQLFASAVVSADQKECRFLNLHADGTAVVHVVTYGSACRVLAGGETVALAELKQCEVLKGAIVVLATDSVIIRSTSVTKVPSLAVEAVCLTNDICVVLADDGSVSALTVDGERKQICSILYERPIALSAHADFDLLVVATLERNLLFYSLSSGIFRTRADLDGELAEQLLITDGWGFVVALTNESIHIFNVNGIRIRRVPNGKHILSLCAWKSASGFDYLCGSDTRGRLMVGEAFYAKFDVSIHYCRGPIKWLNFLGAVNCIAAVAQNGKGYIVPCPALP
jgi:hypothetical protein